MKDFLRRHSRLITFFGAAIVFATFVVKEGIRENLKNLTDSIDNAQSVFLIRSELEDIKQHTGNVGAVKNQNPTMHDFMSHDVHRTWNDLDNIGYQLDNVSRLISKLPDQYAPIGFASTWRNEKEEVVMRADGPITFGNIFEQKQNKTLSGHWQTLQQQRKQLYQDESKVRGLVKPDHSQDEEAARAAALLAGHSNYLVYVTHEFGRLVLGEAMKAKDEREHSYKIYTYISYFLYGLGSLLGLAGRLLGVPGLSET